jgi:2-keto-4-pentenoate hydratase/2-oxohepta-3-ene-1,7-dioic acid hydratase in catechol pathway
MQFVRAKRGSEAARWWRKSALGETFEAWSDAPYAAGATQTDTTRSCSEIGQLLAPAAPSKIVCVGRNYAAHARELGNAVPAEPMLFLKPPSAIIGPHGTVMIPMQSARVEHEAELAVVIGKRARRISAAEAPNHIFGYTCALDMTARDLQRKDVQFTRGKGFDTFCPLGPHIETELDPTALAVVCSVNGEQRQQGVTSQMTFSVFELLSYISHIMTLEPGDVVLTGTPEGVGPVVSGDSISMHIAGIGTLAVAVGSDVTLETEADSAATEAAIAEARRS